jgi:hypothetical protein
LRLIAVWRILHDSALCCATLDRFGCLFSPDHKQAPASPEPHSLSYIFNVPGLTFACNRPHTFHLLEILILTSIPCSHTFLSSTHPIRSQTPCLSLVLLSPSLVLVKVHAQEGPKCSSYSCTELEQEHLWSFISSARVVRRGCPDGYPRYSSERSGECYARVLYPSGPRLG